VHHVLCDLCEMSIQLTKSASAHAFTVHRGSARCRLTQIATAARLQAEVPVLSLPPSPTRSDVSVPVPSSPLNSHHLISFSPKPDPSFDLPVTPRATQPALPSTPRAANTTVLPPSRTTTPPAQVSATIRPGTPPVQFADPPCPGFSVTTPSSIWSGYAWSAHERHGYEWEPFGIEPHTNRIRLRSTTCRRVAAGDANACVSCFRVSNLPQLREFLARAERDPVDHTPHDLLTAEQRRAVDRKMRLLIKKLRDQACILTHLTIWSC
jgi:hypothetical protein